MKNVLNDLINLLQSMQCEIDALKSKVATLENATPNTNQLLDAVQAADYLKIPLKTLYQFTHKNKVRYHKLGRHLLFHTKDLDELLASCHHKTKKDMILEARTKLTIK